MKEKIGLICEGGGTKAAYTAGVLQCFLDNNIEFPYTVGISAGAVCLMPYVSKQRDRLRVTGVDSASRKEAVGLSPLIHEHAVFGIYSTYNYIEEMTPLDHEAYQNSKSQMDIGLYNVNTGEVEYFDKSYHEKDDILLKAACALLLLTKPVKFNNGIYMDGGLVDMIPIEQSIRQGCTKHVFISTKEENYVRKPAAKYQLMLASMSYRKYKHVRKDLELRHVRYNEQWGKVKQLEKEGKAITLRPSRDMGVTRYTQDKELLGKWFDLGYQDTLDRMDMILDFINN